jgi:Zn-dependent M28 family amino/carboxypeptidase
MGYEKDAPKIPAAAVAHEDADLLAELCQSGPVEVHLLMTPQTLPDVESDNVVADLPGTTHKDEIVLVSGHLDSWDLGTGAIDDGAGVAIAMETAHLITSLHLSGERTLRVVTWMNEENGTRGAKAYAAAHAEDHHFAAIESDLGSDCSSGFTAHVDAAHLETLEPLRAIIAEAGAPILEPSFEGGGADIEPLDKMGVPSFGNLQDARRYFDYHHTAADTLDKVDLANLQQNSAVVASFAWGLVNLDAALK